MTTVMTTRAARPIGFVSIVGAGPGDPDLLTQRAVRRLNEADLVLHDGLVPNAILALAPHAEHRSVAKRAGDSSRTQDDINHALIEAAHQGGRIVRLKSGDPFVLGRGGEEALALANASVPFEIVPGLSSAIAAPGLAGIPVTHRGLASAFVVVSGHDPRAWTPIVSALTPGSATIVVLMGLKSAATIAAALLLRGWMADTPTAIVASASQPDSDVTVVSLAELSQPDLRLNPFRPGVIVIGQVVSLRQSIAAAGVSFNQESAWQPVTIHKR